MFVVGKQSRPIQTLPQRVVSHALEVFVFLTKLWRHADCQGGLLRTQLNEGLAC
jgi:hypothetical protein